MGSLSFQNDMEPDNKPISLSFVEIKKSLDPACSYMIFETALGSREGGGFREIIDVLSRLKKGVLKQEVHHDESRGCLLLVVKLDSNQTDKIIQKFLEFRLPEDITFYVYGTRLKE